MELSHSGKPKVVLFSGLRLIDTEKKRHFLTRQFNNTYYLTIFTIYSPFIEWLIPKKTFLIGEQIKFILL